MDSHLEMEVILSCLRGRLLPSLEPQHIQLINWGKVGNLAQRHRVVCQVMAGLKRLAPSLPESGKSDYSRCISGLEKLHLFNAARCAMLERQMILVIETLKQAGINAVPWKGAVLGIQAHGDSASRQFDDLDFLMPRKLIIPARNALLARGFMPKLEFSDAEQRAHVAAGWGCCLINSAGDVFVELDDNAVPGYFRLRSGKLWTDGSLEEVVVGECSVRTLSARALLILLSAHGTKHLWERLSWIVDIGGLVRRSGSAINWDDTLRTASRLGARRMLLLGLRLAREVTGVELPAEVELRMKADGKVEILACKTMESLRSGENPDRNRENALRFHLAAREKALDRAAMLMNIVFIPSFSDWKAVPLPGPLFPLYYLIRPARILFGLFDGRNGKTAGEQ